MRTTGKLIVIALFILTCTGMYSVVEAHQSGCHRWHSCPSDTGSYVCGDLGYACQYSTYNTNSYGSGSSYSPTYSYPTTPSCPANSYSSGSSCKCNYGYVVDGGKCISGASYCMGEIGLMSTYNSLSNSCECMSGYEIGTSGQCTYKSKSTSNTYYGGYTYDSSLNSCPKNSSQSLINSDSCTCNVGYQVNSKKDKCVKIPKKTNDKMCQATFGKKSEWSGEYSKDDALPYCECKKKYEWNEEGTSCVKVS